MSYGSFSMNRFLKIENEYANFTYEYERGNRKINGKYCNLRNNYILFISTLFINFHFILEITTYNVIYLCLETVKPGKILHS